MTQFTEKSMNLRSSLLDGIKDHPIPAAVASLGLGMLIIGSIWKKGNGRAMLEEKMESAQETVESAREASRQVKSGIMEKAREWTGKAGDYARQFSGQQAGDISESVSESIKGAGTSFSRLIESNPLAAIAVAVAFGAALGFGIPEMGKSKEAMPEPVSMR